MDKFYKENRDFIKCVMIEILYACRIFLYVIGRPEVTKSKKLEPLVGLSAQCADKSNNFLKRILIFCD